MSMDQLISLIINNIQNISMAVAMVPVLIICLVYAISAIRSWDKDPNNRFRLYDLICTDGVVDETKTTRMGAFVVSSWGFVYMTSADKMTEWYFLGYMAAWVGNALFSSYLGSKDTKHSDKIPNTPSNKIPRSTSAKIK
jgi:hypothetical protein